MSRQSIKDRYESAINIVKGDLLAKSVVKATTEEEIPPKEKHLMALEAYTRTSLTSMPDFVSALQQRLVSPNWLVVTKSLMTIHYLLINGEDRFALYLTSNLSIFSNLFNFSELVKEQNRTIVNFLEHYAAYLKVKLETYYRLGFDVTKSLARLNFDDKTIKDLLPICNNLNSLSTSTFDTQIHKHTFSSKMLLFIFNLMYQDVSKAYCCYNKVLAILLKEFYNADKDTGQQILREFECYLRHQTEFASLFENAKELLNVEIPVELIEERVYDEMKSYLNSNDKPLLIMEQEIPQTQPQPNKGDLEDLLFDMTGNPPPNVLSQSEQIRSADNNYEFLFPEESSFANDQRLNQVSPQTFDMLGPSNTQNSEHSHLMQPAHETTHPNMYSTPQPRGTNPLNMNNFDPVQSMGQSGTFWQQPVPMFQQAQPMQQPNAQVGMFDLQNNFAMTAPEMTFSNPTQRPPMQQQNATNQIFQESTNNPFGFFDI